MAHAKRNQKRAGDWARSDFERKGALLSQAPAPPDPPFYGDQSRNASTAFRRPKQDSAPLPSAAYGLVPTGFRQSHVPKGPPGQVVGEDWGVLTKKARAKGHRRALCPFTCSAHPFSGLCPGRRPLGAQVCPDPVSTRPEAVEGTARAVVRCPPESRRRTPTDAPVALSGVLRGQILRARDALGPEAKPICAPKWLFGSFLSTQKGTRSPGETGKSTRLPGRDPAT